MNYEDYLDLTPGQRMAARGCTALRPWHKDHAHGSLVALCDEIAKSPWVEAELGGNVTVRVLRAPEGGVVSFVVSVA